jgi:hypothetical protein
MGIGQTIMSPFIGVTKWSLKKLANCSIVDAHNKNYVNKIEKYTNGVAVMSIITKDIFNSYFYVSQSLKNKDIPQEKRKFVAALDLMNGILMCLTGLATFVVTNKFQPTMFKKLFGKFFDRAATKSIISELTRSNNPQIKSLSTDELKKAITNVKEVCEKGFGTVISLVASAIIAKRVIVPFIATPLASWFKDKYMNDPKGTVQNADTCTKIEQTSSAPVRFLNSSNLNPVMDLYSKVKNHH